jgi:hypothetical protein
LDILSIEFPPEGQMKLTVQMPEAGSFTTQGLPHLPKRLFRLFPQLTRHKCENDFGYSFRQECRNTELPHLLEHLIIEMQSQAEPHGVLRGHTVWDWKTDPRGRFHVYVDYDNEILAVAAVRLAERVIKAIDAREMERVDVDVEMERLRDIARIGRELAAGLPSVGGHSWDKRAAPAPAAMAEAIAPA